MSLTPAVFLTHRYGAECSSFLKFVSMILEQTTDSSQSTHRRRKQGGLRPPSFLGGGGCTARSLLKNASISASIA